MPRSGEKCELCNFRFNRVKRPRKYAFEGGHICDGCYKKEREQAEAELERVLLQQVSVVRTHSAPPSLTPEKQTQMRTHMKAEAIGQQGKSRSVGEKARVVLALEQHLHPTSPLKQLNYSYDSTVKWLARSEHIAPKQIRQWHQAAAAGAPLENPPVQRMSLDDPLHMRFGETGPSLPVELCLFQHLRDCAEDNLYSSLSTLIAHVFQQTGESIPKSTMWDWLGKLRMRYAEKKLTGLPRAYTAVLVRRYLVRYAELLRREKKGGIVLVWMDESYIHAGYCANTVAIQRLSHYAKSIRVRHESSTLVYLNTPPQA